MLTLPKMIDAVVQQRGNHPGLRVVYPLDMLRVELAGDRTHASSRSGRPMGSPSPSRPARRNSPKSARSSRVARRSGSASEKWSFSKRYTRQTIGACRRKLAMSNCSKARGCRSRLLHLHRSPLGRFYCKSLFALVIKISFGCTREFRVKMWGTSSPEDKLAGDRGNVIEATSTGGRRSEFLQQKY